MHKAKLTATARTVPQALWAGWAGLMPWKRQYRARSLLDSPNTGRIQAACPCPSLPPHTVCCWCRQNFFWEALGLAVVLVQG